METLYEIFASEIEEGDTIRMDGEEIEVLKMIGSTDIHGVSFQGHNLTTGFIEPYELPFDYCVDVLGA